MSNTGQAVSIGAVSRELGLSPSRIRQLTDLGVFSAQRTEGSHRRYDLDLTRGAWLRYRAQKVGLTNFAAPVHAAIDAPTLALAEPLAGLEEDRVWSELSTNLDIDPKSPAGQVSQYVFTEMLNNAIDHSGGTNVSIQVWLSDAELVFEISDDGIGALRRLREGKDLPDLYSAASELTKGKQTTAPDRHSGEGIFFSSKAVDLFSLESNGVAWIVDNLRNDNALGSSTTTVGTKVRFEIDPQTHLDLGRLFRQFTEDSAFTRSRPVIKLFGLGVTFVSRSEAKRLLGGLEKFTEVELDFTGVDTVGQGFVDEVFRVWPQIHPDTALSSTGMNPAVEFMIKRAVSARQRSGRDVSAGR